MLEFYLLILLHVNLQYLPSAYMSLQRIILNDKVNTNSQELVLNIVKNKIINFISNKIYQGLT